MCGSCNRFCTNLHMLWSLFYVCIGAVQIVAGIFFLTTIPMYQLGVNICAGTWNILFGIAGGLISCFGDSLSVRHEILLYMTISILIVNTINGVFCEWHFYMSDDLQTLVKDPNTSTIVFYARVTTGICAAVVMIISFIDTQLAFCAIEINERSDKKNQMKSKGSHEQVSDIEYIIPRPKTSSAPKPAKSVYNAYAQSWVFDAESTVTSVKSTDRSYLKLDDVLEKSLEPVQPVKASSPKQYYIKHDSIVTNGGSVAGSDKTFIVTTTKPIVHIEEASDDSGSNVGDRKLGYMKSFSATPSPHALSASSSQVSLVNAPAVPIYECLERLTEPSVYRTRLNTAISERSDHGQCPSPGAGPCKSPGVDRSSVGGGEKVQYASLMMELEAQIMAKKNRKSVMSPPLSVSDSVTVSDKSSQQGSSRTTEPSSSDVEFSKELEAALQLIQDLESPNTTELSDSVTKSAHVRKPVAGENRALVVWRHSDASESDEKTLSAVGSLVELASPMTDHSGAVAPLEVLHSFKPGKKLAAALTVSTDSQSTSGYSSPTHLLSKGHTPNSSINGSASDIGKPLACQITNTKTSAVISLYTPTPSPQSELILTPNTTDTLPKRKSITLVNIQNTNNDDLATIVREKLLDPSNDRYASDNNIARYTTIDGHIKSSTLSHYKHERLPDGAKTNSSSLNRLSLPTSGPVWNVKSLLRKKKASVPPQLPPDLEGAIFKSESLAYLSDVELLARHERNKEIQRQIELRVQQQLGQIPTESHC